MAKLILVMCFSLKLIQFCALTVFLSVLHPSGANLCVETIFQISPLHNDLDPVDLPTKQLNVSNKVLCSMRCYYSATCTGFFYRYDGTCSLFSIRFHQIYFVKGNGSQGYETPLSVASDCYDVMMMGYSTDGRYTITLHDGQPMDVWCEIKHPEGWIVIQRRLAGSQDFGKSWNTYNVGFGNVAKEFWLGNTNIHRLTSQGHYDLKIELEDFDGKTSYALYKNFSVSSEQDNFRLSIGEYSGNAGDAFGVHHGAMFSSIGYDVDASTTDCAGSYYSGWWFTDCFTCSLNGRYFEDGGVPTSSIYWNNLAMKKTAMKIRPMN